MSSFSPDDVMPKNIQIVMLAALSSIQRECETAIDRPEVSFTSICRIASLARQIIGPPDADVLPAE